MILDYLRFSMTTFKERKIRSALTMLGIFIGIAAIVALISLGQGLQKEINEQFEALGVDKIMVMPGSGLASMGSEGIELTDKDLDITKRVAGMKDAAGMITKMAKVKSGDEIKYTFVIGLPVDSSKRIIESIQTFKIAKGRDLKDGDKYNAAVGIRIHEQDLFKKAVKIGDKIEIEGIDFKIVGGMERIGNPADDSQIYIPLETARSVLDAPTKYDAIVAQVKEGADVEKVSEDVKKELRKSRGVEEKEEDFNVQTSEQMIESYSTILATVQYIVIGIAAISLLVGGVGIMNTMYTSVLERTQHIGVMKAVGAKNSDILLLFLIESGLLGLVGGMIGVLIGIGLSQLVVYSAAAAGMAMIKAYFPWYLILGSLAFSFVVGSVSGLLPAIQAARLQPTEALRYE